MDVMLRSIGMEPEMLDTCEKWLLIARENNFNLCELGPRKTGKSHLYKEISTNSILVIPDRIYNPGQVYTVSQVKSGMIGVFRLESQMLPNNGKFERTLDDSETQKECLGNINLK